MLLCSHHHFHRHHQLGKDYIMCKYKTKEAMKIQESERERKPNASKKKKSHGDHGEVDDVTREWARVTLLLMLQLRYIIFQLSRTHLVHILKTHTSPLITIIAWLQFGKRILWECCWFRASFNFCWFRKKEKTVPLLFFKVEILSNILSCALSLMVVCNGANVHKSDSQWTSNLKIQRREHHYWKWRWRRFLLLLPMIHIISPRMLLVTYIYFLLVCFPGLLLPHTRINLQWWFSNWSGKRCVHIHMICTNCVSIM